MMKINDVKVNRIQKWVTVSITYRHKKIDFSFIVVDGKITGDHTSNMSTSYLTYFHTVSEKVHKSHFEFLKNYIETMIK